MISLIGVQRPFKEIAVDVVQAPCIVLQLAERFRLAATVSDTPSVLVQFFNVTAVALCCLISRWVGVLSFSLGRQSVHITERKCATLLFLFCEPLPEFTGFMPSDSV